MKREERINFASSHSGASIPDIFEIETSLTPVGRFQSSTGSPLWAKFIKSLQIGPAALSPSPERFTVLPSVFPAHTTVVI